VQDKILNIYSKLLVNIKYIKVVEATMHKNITFFNLQKRSLASKEALHSPNYIDSWLGFLYYNLMPPIERAPFICHPEK
jgi:hypothetical protein